MLLESIIGSPLPEEQVELGIKWVASGKFERRLVDGIKDIQEFAQQERDNANIFFGPTYRKKGDSDTITRCAALWADVDGKNFDTLDQALQSIAKYPLFPSFLIYSGHGYHAYWIMYPHVDPESAQEAMKKINKIVGADHLHNPKSLMRVPGTINYKADPCVESTEVVSRPDLCYNPSDILAATKVRSKVRALINEEQAKGDRSEIDFLVVSELLEVGMSKEAIEKIFEERPVGAKYREPNNGHRYLDLTIKNAREKDIETEEIQSGESPVKEDEEGYLVHGAKGWHRVSTFTFQPTRLVTDPEGVVEDSFIGTIKSGGQSWDSIIFRKSAFGSSQNLIRALPKIEWQWIGSDYETKQLLLHITNRAACGSCERTFGVTAVGRHDKYWVTKDQTLSADGVFDPNTAPYTFFGTAVRARGRQVDTTPTLEYSLPTQDEITALLKEVSQVLPETNEKLVVLPMLGWFMATPIKPLLWECGIPFPHLNVFGTKGSGKTATVIHVYMKMLGMVNPGAWTPNTTSFVLRSLFSSTNSVPVYFGEYRAATIQAGDFLRTLLMAYDAGRDARGRADLTTETFPLSAPVVIDGEDTVTDPTGAIKERLIVVNTHPVMVQDTMPSARAFRKLLTLPLHDVGGRYIQFTLRETHETIMARFNMAMQQFDEMWHGITPPERVRRNVAVVMVGIGLFNDFLSWYGVEPIQWVPGDLRDIVRNTVQLLLNGSSRAQVDDFVEDLIAVVSRGSRAPFIFAYDPGKNILYFHLVSAHGWWHGEQRRRGKNILEIPAMRGQLEERIEYVANESMCAVRTVDDTYNIPLIGIKVEKAQEFGLSIPNRLTRNQVLISGGTVL